MKEVLGKSDPATFAQRDGRESGLSIVMTCRTFQISESCYRYECKLGDENAEIADCLPR